MKTFKGHWTILFLIALTLPAGVLANVPVPVTRLIPQLQQTTKLPILIPTLLPVAERLYTQVEESSANAYELSFNYTPDCRGTACSWGGFSARQGEQPMTSINPEDTIERITLANGVRGQFLNACGAYCTASVQWQSQGVLYTASIKNGRKADVIALANSAIQAGVRKPSR